MPENLLVTSTSKLRRVSTCKELFKGTSAVIAAIGGWPIDTEAFNPFKTEILQHFTPRPEFQDSAGIFLRKIGAEVYGEVTNRGHNLDLGDYDWDNDPLVFVSVHIRRTDYKKHMQKQMGRSNLVTKMYFDTAMTFFKERHNTSRVIFVLVTDDEAWGRRMFQERNDVVFASSGHR